MQTIGPALFAKTAEGRYVSSIGTLFPGQELLVTAPPMHALQRETFKEWQAETEAAGAMGSTGLNLDWQAAESVDLILAPGDVVLIRPELERLDLAFQADEQLHELWKVPRHRIRFLSVRDPRIRQALRERGELWRISTAPSDRDQFRDTILASRVAIAERPIYYYNPHTGTRFVTLAEFARLTECNDAELARQLDEIGDHCRKRNRHSQPEIAFFGVDPLGFGGPNFVGTRFAELAPVELRTRHAVLTEQFREAVEPVLQVDDIQLHNWRQRMFSVIASEQREEMTPEGLQGLNSEFFLRIQWLPGGTYEDGEFFFSPVFPQAGCAPTDPELKPLWDPLARGFISNFIREYGNIEYLNLGRIGASPLVSTKHEGRRGVYLAEIKVRGEVNPRVLFLRLLRWGIRERLEELDENNHPKDLVRAVFDTEEYIDYTLDRRLGCLQFGMHLPARVNMRRVSEPYVGPRAEFRGRHFPVIYFERDYLPGIATDKIPDRRLADPRYARALANLMGKAAAPNLVVGRTRHPASEYVPGEPLFDDGDEIIVENSAGVPREIYLVDHGGAFADWRTPTLLPFARAYAQPVNRRSGFVPDPKAFAGHYLKALEAELLRLQAEYQRRARAFDGLFKHLPYNERGSFACRWERVLARLKSADVPVLIAEIRKHITVLV